MASPNRAAFCLHFFSLINYGIPLHWRGTEPARITCRTGVRSKSSSFLSFAPAKERNKEKQAGNDDSPFPGGFSIKLLNYCGEVHLFPDVVDWLARVFIQHSTFNINSNFYPSAFQLTTYNVLLTTCFIHFRDSSCVGMRHARLFYF